MSRQCRDLETDRKNGANAERRFIAWCTERGYATHALQIGRSKSAAIGLEGKRLIAPDVVIWHPTRGCMLHEIKRKYPTYHGLFGLEEYRFQSLYALSGIMDVWYTIYLHADTEKAQRNIDRANKKYDMHLSAGVWLTANITNLVPPDKRKTGTSWRNSQRSEEMIYYWTPKQFTVITTQPHTP